MPPEAPERALLLTRWILGGLFTLFLFRVLAQCLQWLYPLAWLPGFSSWHGGVLAYPLLLGIQVAICLWCVHMIRNVELPRNGQSAGGIAWLMAGGLYLALASLRLLVGQGEVSGLRWFDATLPAAFHIVLALFLITLGLHGTGKLLQVVVRTIYPLTLLAAITGHLALVRLGAGLATATLAPVAVCAGIIALLENVLPYRTAWRPTRSEVITDSAYMLLVQQLLPRALGYLAALSLLFLTHEGGPATAGWWPHHWPVGLQTVAILLLVEFLRYWLHRLAHHWEPLWRLHAVHHSPDRLYWLNVGRFHPVEKVLQLVFDALPFLLLGISPRVYSLYFVCYAVHGMFQHCNIALKLGFLNRLVSGPELHRWHHSRKTEQSNHNFGNNLILWDWLFGTRYLPVGNQVGELGLRNRGYPKGFVAQLRAPFVRGIDQRDPEHP